MHVQGVYCQNGNDQSIVSLMQERVLGAICNHLVQSISAPEKYLVLYEIR